MKEIKNVIVEKMREVEASFVTLGFGVFVLITLAIAAGVVNNLINMIETIALAIATGAAG